MSFAKSLFESTLPIDFIMTSEDAPVSTIDKVVYIKVVFLSFKLL